MSIVTDLCDRFPHATAAASKWYFDYPTTIRSETTLLFAKAMRNYAAFLRILTDALAVGPLEDVLATIEAKVKPVGITDEEIEALKWGVSPSMVCDGDTVRGGSIDGGYFNAWNTRNRDTAIKAQHFCVDTLAAEIRRLRAEVEKLRGGT